MLVRTVLVALISFMPTKGDGAIAALDYTKPERQALAEKSRSWKCDRCNVYNADLLTVEDIPQSNPDTAVNSSSLDSSSSTSSSSSSSNTPASTPDNASNHSHDARPVNTTPAVVLPQNTSSSGTQSSLPVSNLNNASTSSSAAVTTQLNVNNNANYTTGNL